MNDKPVCCERVFHTGAYRSVPCSKPVKVTRDGVHYCTIHDPERVAERIAKSNAKFAQQMEAQRKSQMLPNAAPDLLEACRAFLRAGIGNSTDFSLQAEAFDLAREAVKKATGGQR